MIILEPYPITAIVPFPSGDGADLLISPDPKEGFYAGYSTGVILDFDLGQERQVDTVFLGFNNFSADTVVGFQKGTGLGVGMTDLGVFLGHAADAVEPFHTLGTLAAPVAARYLRVHIYNLASNPYFGILMVGKRFEAPYELGGGRAIVDTGSKEPLIGGGFGIGEGAVKGTLRWTFPDLDPATRRRLWQIIRSRGETRPVVVAEQLGEGAGTNEEIHYGLLDRLQSYERQAPGMTRWALSMTEWV